MSKSDFYDRLYKANPHKWEIEEYDQFAFSTLNIYFDLDQPKSLLDIGCGNGHTLEYFAKRWPKIAYTGLDLSNEAIQLAYKRMPGASFFWGAFEDTILPNFWGAFEDTILPKKYDCILLLGVIEHFEDLHKSLSILRGIMAENGICYIEAPNCIDYPESIHEEGYRKTNMGSHQEEWHLFRPMWERILIDEGFEIIRSLKGPNMQSEFVWLVR